MKTPNVWLWVIPRWTGLMRHPIFKSVFGMAESYNKDLWTSKPDRWVFILETSLALFHSCEPLGLLFSSYISWPILNTTNFTPSSWLSNVAYPDSSSKRVCIKYAYYSIKYKWDYSRPIWDMILNITGVCHPQPTSQIIESMTINLAFSRSVVLFFWRGSWILPKTWAFETSQVIPEVAAPGRYDLSSDPLWFSWNSKVLLWEERCRDCAYRVWIPWKCPHFAITLFCFFFLSSADFLPWVQHFIGCACRFTQAIWLWYHLECSGGKRGRS